MRVSFRLPLLLGFVFAMASDAIANRLTEPPILLPPKRLFSTQECRSKNDALGTFLIPQPNGIFSAMVFCGDALGSDFGVILTGNGLNVADRLIQMTFPQTRVLPATPWGNETSENRFWQDLSWSRDFTSFAWDSTGRYLFVGTCGIYNEKGSNLWQLDLIWRKAKILWPRRDAGMKLYRLTILGLDEDAHTFTLELDETKNWADDGTLRTIKIKVKDWNMPPPPAKYQGKRTNAP